MNAIHVQVRELHVCTRHYQRFVVISKARNYAGPPQENERFLSSPRRDIEPLYPGFSPCYRVTGAHLPGYAEVDTLKTRITVQRCCQKEAIYAAFKRILDSSDMLSPFGNIQFLRSRMHASFIFIDSLFFKHTHRGLLDRWTLLFSSLYLVPNHRQDYVYILARSSNVIASLQLLLSPISRRRI